MGKKMRVMGTTLSILENACNENGDKEALVDEKRSYTYNEMKRYALKIGGAISCQKQVRRPVVILSERDIRCVVMFWGVLYSGNFYVPLNFKNNKAIFAKILEDIKPIAVLSCDKDEEVEKICEELEIQYDYFENVIADDRELQLPERHILDEDPAYMVFTSGSTGMPKGVVKTHRSVLRFIESFSNTFSVGMDDVFGNQAEFDYDVAAKDIYLSVYLKAKLAIIPRSCFLMPMKLMEYLSENKVTTLIWAVAAVRFAAQSRCLEKYIGKLNVEKVFFSGEVLTQSELNEWIRCFPDVEYVNLYAPSEVTGNCLYYKVDNKNVPEKLPLGKAFDNIEVLVINDNNTLAKEGEMGEICVRGGFLSSGYYKKSDVTQEKYVQNPLHNDYIDLVYKTGDLAQYKGGEIYFCGRKDHQIKFMGHRIELFEIENIFSQVTGIEKNCCVLTEGKLVLYYEGKLEAAEIIKKMKALVPNYKIPKQFVPLDELPKNKRGKIDRVELSKRSTK